MKIIKLYLNSVLMGEGGTTSDEDILPALQMVTKAIKGIEGAKIEITEGSLDDLVSDFRNKFERIYTVSGNYLLGTSYAEISLDIKAVSKQEALEKAHNLGIENPHIVEDDDDEYEDDEYEDDEYDEEDEENDEDDDECCCGHSRMYHRHCSREEAYPKHGQTIEIRNGCDKELGRY